MIRRVLKLGTVAAAAFAVAVLAQGLTRRRWAVNMVSLLVMMQSVGGRQP
jgi:hypothetical protein